MRLRKRLLDPMRPDLAFQLDEIDHQLQRAILVAWQQRERRGDVVGDHHKAVAGIDGEMNGILAFRALPIDHTQRSSGGIDRHGGDVAQVAMHRIEKAPRAVEGEERRIDEIAEALEMRPDAGRIVHAIDVEPIAAGIALLAGARADIDERVGVLGHALLLRSSG